jgi:hypothetical protein
MSAEKRWQGGDMWLGTEWSAGKVTLSREICPGGETRAEVRVLIVAEKAWKLAGAKGHRKVDVRCA